MKQTYERLDRRMKDLFDTAPDIPREEESMRFMEADSIMHFLGAGGIEHYEQVVQFCKDNQIQRVFDIGSAYGHQSECFLDTSIEYIGVDDAMQNGWNSERYTYIQGSYPCPLPTKADDLAVSVLCLTWNCYLHEGERTLHQQCKSLSEDFRHALLYASKSASDTLKEYFTSVEAVEGGFLYCSNN